MEQKQISLETLAKRLYDLELEVGKLKQQKDERFEDIDWDWSDVKVFVDERLLGKAWLSSEEDEAWKDL